MRRILSTTMVTLTLIVGATACGLSDSSNDASKQPATSTTFGSASERAVPSSYPTGRANDEQSVRNFIDYVTGLGDASPDEIAELYPCTLGDDALSRLAEDTSSIADAIASSGQPVKYVSIRFNRDGTKADVMAEIPEFSADPGAPAGSGNASFTLALDGERWQISGGPCETP